MLANDDRQGKHPLARNRKQAPEIDAERRRGRSSIVCVRHSDLHARLRRRHGRRDQQVVLPLRFIVVEGVTEDEISDLSDKRQAFRDASCVMRVSRTEKRAVGG